MGCCPVFTNYFVHSIYDLRLPVWYEKYTCEPNTIEWFHFLRGSCWATIRDSNWRARDSRWIRIIRDSKTLFCARRQSHEKRRHSKRKFLFNEISDGWIFQRSIYNTN